MKKMTMMEHFSELRRRILWTALWFLVAFIAGFFVAPYIQEFLTRPLLDVWGNGELLYSGITDGIMIELSLAVLVALLLTVPAALWNLWAFVAPGLHKNERSFIFPILVLSPILFLMGAAFAFYVLFPIVFEFFLRVNESAPIPAVIMPVARDYLSFAIGLLKVFGLAFEMPLVLVLLNRVGILRRSVAVRARRYAIVIIAAVAAILTPPDVVSQLLLALPMWGLFEVSILFMKKD